MLLEVEEGRRGGEGRRRLGGDMRDIKKKLSDSQSYWREGLVGGYVLAIFYGNGILIPELIIGTASVIMKS